MRNAMNYCGVALVLVMASTALWSNPAAAHPRYDGCSDCHGDFDDSTSPQGTVFPSGDKHEMHRGSQHMDTECNLCHIMGSFSNPFIDSSEGTPNNPGLGCLGCHGRDYGGDIGVSGVGLRAHHTAAGVTECAACHPDDPTPLPENIKPTYYGTVDTKADDPCNAGPGFLENWSIGDTLGSDNDGDLVYDEADSDCAMSLDCDPPSAAACPEADVNCDDIADGFDIAVVRQGTNWLLAAADADEPRADVNRDGIVDGFDIAAIRGGLCWLQ